MLRFRTALRSLIALGVVACGDPLLVDNVNDPDRNRVLGTPADIEAFVGSAYAQVHNATLGGSNDDVQTQLQVMGMENTSALANFAMNPRGAIPRNPIDNTRGSQGSDGNLRDYVVNSRAARMAAIGIGRLNVLTLGDPGRDARARAFARFVQGAALGNLALVYDSASIITENDDPQALYVSLAGYKTVMAAALGYLDSAVAIANANGNGFPLPSSWINGQALTRDNFVRFVKSYKARFRASVARTPAERADVGAGGIVDWTRVVAEADSGITADFSITMNPSAGWDVVWPIQAFATGAADWGQMVQFWMGMADNSGNYDAWLALPVAQRAPFVVVTADLRFPQGATRGAQQADTLRASYKSFTGVPYFRNRPAGEDKGGQPLQISMYDFYRSRAFASASRIGAYPIMTRAEIRLLAAEGNIRLNQIAAAVARIDSSRSLGRGGLPSLAGAGITDVVTPIPGAQCVPRVPDAAAAAGPYRASTCGNLWDALKWEYRMETAFTGYGMWYFAARGWGDLPEGTAIHWPVPYQEMDSRRQAFYGLGGAGSPGGAGPGNYGLFGCGVVPRPGAC
jgi:hypothetical protein